MTSDRVELLPDISVEDLIADRDQVQDMADRLAEAIAGLLGVEIGEHSTMNDPWANALAAAADHHARRRCPARPAAETKDTWCHCVEAGYPGPHRRAEGCEVQQNREIRQSMNADGEL